MSLSIAMRVIDDLNIETKALDGLLAEIATAGVLIEVEAARAWLEAVVRADATPEEFAIAVEAGLGGHELAMIDFDLADVERLRRLGRSIRTPVLPGVSSALAIAGSTAQGRIHPFPADVDFFERVHIVADDEAAARRRLADLVRAGATVAAAPTGFVPDNVLFGTAPDGTRLRWSPADVENGTLTLRGRDGDLGRVTWSEAAADPGFVKLDWIVTGTGELDWVTKVIDATWQSPAGPVLSLDGRIDADYQQVYLDADGANLAARLTASLRDGDRAWYIHQLELEVRRYGQARPPNFGKIARRLYNLCRLTGRYVEALYLRGLFAGPAARLYQARPRLHLIVARDRHDPAAAQSGLALLIDDLAEFLPLDASLPRAIAACQATLRDRRSIDFLAATTQLDAALAESTSQAFGQGLLAFPPVAELLEELGIGR